MNRLLLLVLMGSFMAISCAKKNAVSPVAKTKTPTNVSIPKREKSPYGPILVDGKKLDGSYIHCENFDGYSELTTVIVESAVSNNSSSVGWMDIKLDYYAAENCDGIADNSSNLGSYYFSSDSKLVLGKNNIDFSDAGFSTMSYQTILIEKNVDKLSIAFSEEEADKDASSAEKRTTKISDIKYLQLDSSL